ncbi:bifunctional methylenetetrahydrofolate dehydrogenase/cyclohydrolase, mitochondrial [Nasonia vitripennis]|uniref:methenyltetrahydrofolate cyclohydrolase n=1 Tax=Nasonia vitripennis TaxID=7425 RepID=A0A7M7QSM1_NASVI|nr:bifunctional methylenetetrahydrofolate dehydrogenase/cyclohydrolase, mitochondrial [Nasonia vitripennis]XP_032453070.1 bifunctional methylenetetrahydrofolate dehydrogenase/cyclohydrolase, mitochondrial [Nasonia vitripennis]
MSVFKILRPLASQWASRGLHTTNRVCDAAIIDGNGVADQVLEEVKAEVDEMTRNGEKRPKLIAILVGNNPASKAYVGRKVKAAKTVGIESETLRFEDSITQEELLHEVQKLNDDPTVDGLLVQLPVPEHISEREVCQAVTPTKDVDGFHLSNIGNLALNNKGIIPATALGVKELIVRSKIPTFGKNAVVIGRSKHVGFPIALLLHSDGNGETAGLDMTTTICHRYTPRVELERYTKLADIVVASAGVPGLVTKEMIKPGACVIDVGISRIKTSEGKYRLVGDVNYESVKTVAGHITPVPGGVGPMTVAMLMKNTLFAIRLRKSLENK